MAQIVKCDNCSKEIDWIHDDHVFVKEEQSNNSRPDYIFCDYSCLIEFFTTKKSVVGGMLVDL